MGILLAVAGAGLCTKLGCWQLDRARTKQALVAAFEAGQTRTIKLETADLESLDRYQNVEFSGRYDGAHQILLDNMPSARGQPGYRVLTPLQLEQGDWLLIDRGWVAAGATRSQLPDITVAANLRTLRGRVDELPRPGMRIGEPPRNDPSSWPLVLHFPEHEQLMRVLRRRISHRIVLLDAAQSEGYERAWKANLGFGPERHIAYAVQWFALALTVGVVFLIMSFKPEIPRQ